MDTITVSKEVLAAYLGKGSTELDAALFATNEAGEKTPKPQNEIDKILKQELTDKATAIKAAGKSEGEGMGKRLNLTEVEKFISDELGISEGQDWKEKLSKIKEKMKNPKPGEVTPESIRNSEIYLQDLKRVKDELIAEREAHQATRKETKQREIYSQSDEVALSILRDEKNKFQLPQDQNLAKSWEKIYLEKIRNGDVLISLDDKGKPTVLTKDGKQLEDEQYNPVSFDSYCMSIAKNIFPTTVSGQRADATPGQTSTATKINDFAIPEFKTLEDYSKFIDDNMTNPKATPEVMEAAKAKISNLLN